jgi:hypothetical protein
LSGENAKSRAKRSFASIAILGASPSTVPAPEAAKETDTDIAESVPDTTVITVFQLIFSIPITLLYCPPVVEPIGEHTLQFENYTLRPSSCFGVVTKAPEIFGWPAKQNCQN